MVTRTVADDEVLDQAVARARSLAAGLPDELGQTCRLVRGSWEAGRAATGADEARAIGRAVASPDVERLLTSLRRGRPAGPGAPRT